MFLKTAGMDYPVAVQNNIGTMNVTGYKWLQSSTYKGAVHWTENQHTFYK